MTHFHEHTVETYKHGEARFYQCADVECRVPLYALDHPSLCKHCGHARSQHEDGCNASVREGIDGVARCECPMGLSA